MRARVDALLGLRRRLLSVPLACSRTLHTAQQLQDGGDYPLPWPHSDKPIRPSDPYIHRLVGMFLLRRVANTHGYKFSISEFLGGVREAVYALAESIANRQSHNQLDEFVGHELCSALKESLTSLPDNAHVHLDIESLRNIHLSSINAIVGEAAPGDDHVISWLGQKVITSQSRLKDMMDEDSKFTFGRARELGKEATVSRLEFQLRTSFNTKEKFAVLDEEGKVVMGSNQFRNCFHIWTFSSTVAWETDEYPFQWSITDINEYVEEHRL